LGSGFIGPSYKYRQNPAQSQILFPVNLPHLIFAA